MTDEENQITVTKAARAILLSLHGDRPSFRLKAERSGNSYVNWLHWDDFKERFDEEISIKEDGKEILIYVDPDSFAFLAGGNTVIDYTKWLLTHQFVFQSDYTDGQYACGEPYEMKSR